MNTPRQSVVFLLAALVAVALASPAIAATKHHTRSVHAKVPYKEARATAMAKVPGGKIVKHELEREHGKLVYSFDMRVPGKTGIQEVQVDAMNGDVVSQTHESPKKERQEAHQEQMESKASTGTNTGH